MTWNVDSGLYKERDTVLLVLFHMTCFTLLIWKLFHLNTNVWTKSTNNSMSLVTRFINNQSLKWVRIFVRRVNCSISQRPQSFVWNPLGRTKMFFMILIFISEKVLHCHGLDTLYMKTSNISSSEWDLDIIFSALNRPTSFFNKLRQLE